jgi:glycosyltransferase involved in cell wall biosynthesis
VNSPQLFQEMDSPSTSLIRPLELRILFLHEVNYLTKPIFEMHELPEELALRGHQVGFVQFPEGEETSSRFKFLAVEEVRGRTRVGASITLFTPGTLGSGNFSRLVTAMLFSIQFSKILREFRPDVVVSYSVPTSGWQALRACKEFEIPYLFRALDVSHKIRRSAFSGLIRKAEHYIYSNSTWVSANNPAMLDYCVSMGAYPLRISLELPPLNFGHFCHSEELDLRGGLGIPADAKVALYMGSFFYFSGLSAVLREFADCRRDNEILVLVGGGEQERELKILAEDLGIASKVLFTGFVAFEKLPGYLAIADVAFNSMEPSLVSNAAFPNKVIQYMAAALPVVSTDLSGLSKTFAETEGLRYVAGSGEVFAAVQKLFDQPDLQALGVANRTLASKTFSMQQAVAAFEGRVVAVTRMKGEQEGPSDLDRISSRLPPSATGNKAK